MMPTKHEQLEGELRVANHLLSSCKKERDLLAKQFEEANKKIGIHEWEILETRKDKEQLAKQNHKMREALEKIKESSCQGSDLSPATNEYYIAKEVLSLLNTTNLIVLTREEVEKLPCGCDWSQGYVRHWAISEHVNGKCHRCLLLERFTK